MNDPRVAALVALVIMAGQAMFCFGWCCYVIRVAARSWQASVHVIVALAAGSLAVMQIYHILTHWPRGLP